MIQWSRHQLQRIEVATSLSGRDISYKELRSPRHSVVATSASSKEGRDIIQWSRHHFVRKAGRDVIQRSRHQIQRMLMASRDQIKDYAT